jgi:hypothetical protein
MFARRRKFLREAPTKAPSKAPNNPFKKNNATSSSLLQIPYCTNPLPCADADADANYSSTSKSSYPFLLRLFFYTCLSLLTLITILYIYTHYIHPISSAYDLNIKPKTPNQFISRDYDFLHYNKRKRRQKHFMNVEERIQIYMSNWYVKPCVEDGNVGVMKVDERLNYVYSHVNDVDFYDQHQHQNNNDTYYQIQFIDRNEEEMLLATMETKVLYDVPFVLQPNLIEACALHHTNTEHNSINNNFNNNISQYYFCQDAMHMINLIKNLDIEMDKSDAYSSSTIKTNALQIQEWNGDTHPLPIIVQFITSPSINNPSSKSKHSISVIESYLMENPIPYIQEYRKATVASSGTRTDKGATHSKQSKAILNEVTNEKNLHCSIPGLRKHLHIQGEEQLSLSYYSPIVWFFNSKYHLNRLKYVIEVDIPWNWKRDDVVIVNLDDGGDGGGNTMMNMMAQQKKNFQLLNLSIHLEQDLNVPLVASSSTTPTNMNDKQRIETMLKSKIIVLPCTHTLQSMNELKWILYSRSILLMPPPSLTTFVMEERLEPFVHYIPLESMCIEEGVDPTKLFQSMIKQIKWILQNPYKARKIAEQGTLYIHDLFFHEDAYDDNKMIEFEILKRYSHFFVDNALL